MADIKSTIGEFSIYGYSQRPKFLFFSEQILKKEADVSIHISSQAIFKISI